MDKIFGLVPPSIGAATPASGYCSESEGGTSSQTDAASKETGPVSAANGFATGFENLERFAELVNREAYWVPSEICAEQNLSKRVDTLKRFIKASLENFIQIVYTVPCGDSSIPPIAYTHARVARAIAHVGVCADVVS